MPIAHPHSRASPVRRSPALHLPCDAKLYIRISGPNRKPIPGRPCKRRLIRSAFTVSASTRPCASQQILLVLCRRRDMRCMIQYSLQRLIKVHHAHRERSIQSPAKSPRLIRPGLLLLPLLRYFFFAPALKLEVTEAPIPCKIPFTSAACGPSGASSRYVW